MTRNWLSISRACGPSALLNTLSGGPDFGRIAVQMTARRAPVRSINLRQQPSVDHDVNAAKVTRLVAGEEQSHIGHVLRLG